MKRFILGLLLLVGVTSAFSQPFYFVYLHSENGQPFFIKMNEKVYSSNATGHLVLTKLGDSAYPLTIGFPGNTFTEQRFILDVKGRDRGYLLKNFGEKGWGLSDMQTSSVQMPLVDKRSQAKMELRDDLTPFTEILAKAANDPSLRMRPVVVKEEEKPIVVEAARKEVAKVEEKKVADTKPVPGNGGDVVKDKPIQEMKDTVEKETVSKRSDIVTKPVTDDGEKVIKKTDSTVSNKPVEGVAIKPPLGGEEKEKSKEENKRDTIEKKTARADQPVIESKPGEAVKPEEKKETANREPVVKTEADNKEQVVKVEPKKEVTEYRRTTVTKKSESSTSEGLGLTFIDDWGNGKADTIRIMIPNPRVAVVRDEAPGRKFLDISSADTGDAKKVVVEKKEVEKAGSCKTVATEGDVSKLQKKMIGEKDDDDKVDEARKVFRNRCVTVEQLKLLSALFSGDAGRYKLFDAAYGYVADAANFAGLITELKEEYYINRFKAMLR